MFLHKKTVTHGRKPNVTVFKLYSDQPIPLIYYTEFLTIIS